MRAELSEIEEIVKEQLEEENKSLAKTIRAIIIRVKDIRELEEKLGNLLNQYCILFGEEHSDYLERKENLLIALRDCYVEKQRDNQEKANQEKVNQEAGYRTQVQG